MNTPKRIWWARAGKLCALERPGGGGRSHRPERRAAEIDYLAANGVHTVVSLMTTRHNLAAYEEAGLEWRHVPLDSCAEAVDALDDLLRLLRRELRRRGAVAIHANRHTDRPAARRLAHLRDRRDRAARAHPRLDAPGRHAVHAVELGQRVEQAPVALL